MNKIFIPCLSLFIVSGVSFAGFTTIQPNYSTAKNIPTEKAYPRVKSYSGKKFHPQLKPKYTSFP